MKKRIAVALATLMLAALAGCSGLTEAFGGPTPTPTIEPTPTPSPTPEPICNPLTGEMGDYEVQMSTDDFCYGGSGRAAHTTYIASRQPDGRIGFQVYLPNRSAIVLKKKKQAE